jgi:hypothetical protein
MPNRHDFDRRRIHSDRQNIRRHDDSARSRDVTRNAHAGKFGEVLAKLLKSLDEFFGSRRV